MSGPCIGWVSAICVIWGVVDPAIVGATFRIDPSVVAVGGGTITSAHHSMTTTIGQPLASTSRSASYEISGGMWPILASGPDCFNCPPVTQLSLGVNVPNPFSQATTISFALPKEEHVTVQVFDALGRRVASVADALFPPGSHSLRWSGAGDSGVRLASGVYLIRLTANGGSRTRRVVLFR